MNASPRIGMDIGGTKIEAISFSPTMAVEERIVVPTVPGPEGVLNVTEQAVRTLAEKTGRSVADYAAVGIGIPGQVDREHGVVRNSYNMGLNSLALGAELGARVGLPVSLDNDVTAASIGANHLMGLHGTVAYVNFGTGLAAGVVIDGKPLRGAHGFAGEIGHLPIDPRGRACGCGQFGCLETAASGSALKKYWPAGGEHPGRTLNAAIAAGDEVAAEQFGYLVNGAASAFRILGLTLNPDTFVIGGGLRLLGEPFFDAIRATLDSWAASSGFIAALELSERLQVLPADSPAASIGAMLSTYE